MITCATLLCGHGWSEETVFTEEQIVLQPFPSGERPSIFDATDAAKSAPWRHARVGDIEVLSSCADRTTRAFVEEVWRQRALVRRALPTSMRDDAGPILLFLYQAAPAGPPAPYLRHGPYVVDFFSEKIGRSFVRVANLVNFEERVALRNRGADTVIVEAIDSLVTLRGTMDRTFYAESARWWPAGRIAFSLDLVFSPAGIRCRWPPGIGRRSRMSSGENQPPPDNRRILPLQEIISDLPPYDDDGAAYHLTLGLFMRWAVLADGGKHLRGIERFSRRTFETGPTAGDFAHDVGVDLTVVQQALARMLDNEGGEFARLLAKPRPGDKPPLLRLRDAASDELRRFKQAVDEVGRRIPRL